MSDLFNSLGSRANTPKDNNIQTKVNSAVTWEDMSENLSSLIEKLTWLHSGIVKHKSSPKASRAISKELSGILSYVSELVEFANIESVDLLNAIPSSWKSLLETTLRPKKAVSVNTKRRRKESTALNFCETPKSKDPTGFMTFTELTNIGNQGKQELIEHNIKLQQELRSLKNTKLGLEEEKSFYQS
jgi:hypothetical protein